MSKTACTSYCLHATYRYILAKPYTVYGNTCMNNGISLIESLFCALVTYCTSNIYIYIYIIERSEPANEVQLNRN